MNMPIAQNKKKIGLLKKGVTKLDLPSTAFSRKTAAGFIQHHFLFSKTKSGAGFTLVEMLVVVFIFSLLIGVLFNYLTFAVKDQRASLAAQRVIDEGSYVGEYMSRALRQAITDEAGSCLDVGSGFNYESSAISVRFLDQNNKCREFVLDTGLNQLQERLSSDDTKAGLTGTEVSLTSNDLEVQSFNIVLDGQDETDDQQPRVTFSLKMKSLAGESVTLLQTTITQRAFDVNE